MLSASTSSAASESSSSSDCVATRYEKTARNYLAVVTIAAFVLWLR